MIPNNTNVAVVDNRLDGRKIEMKIDTDATVHLMSLLTALYSDQEMACLREYATNADDAHKDARQTRPIEVTTPTSLSPYLRIKDWGVGMDAQTIEDVYSQYGRSTKRAQTDTNGSMGIGGKSALSYTNQFSVIGVKNSIKTHVSVSIGPDGGGIMEIVDESFTNEPNGVEIVIPAKRYNDFQSKANSFFRFWKPGSVLLNGKDPAGNFKKVSEHVYIIENADYYATDVIVMGNVAYPVKDGLSGGDTIHKYGRKVVLAAYVTMNTPNEVVFTPSREGLIYTQQTNKSIGELRAEYRAAVLKDIQTAMTSVTTYGAAYREFLRLSSTYSSALLGTLSFRNSPMPTGYVMTNDTRPNAAPGSVVHKRATIWSLSSYRHAVQTGRDISYEQIMAGMIITNYPNTTGVSGPHKAKIRSYIEDADISTNNVIFLPDDKVPGSPWTDEATIVDWSNIKSIKLTSNNSNYAAKSYAGGYDVFSEKVGYYVLNHSLDINSEIVYYSKAQNESSYISGADRDMILNYLPDANLVETSANRFEKLVRLFPKALSLHEARVKVAGLVVASLTDLEKEQIRIQSVDHLDYLRGIDYTEISDPFLSRAVEVYRMKATVGTRAFGSILRSARDKAVEAIGSPEFGSVLSRYPLLSWNNSYKNDTLIYINAKYATIAKGI